MSEWKFVSEVITVQWPRLGWLGRWDRLVSRITGRPVRTVPTTGTHTYFTKKQDTGEPLVSDVQVHFHHTEGALKWRTPYWEKPGVKP